VIEHTAGGWMITDLGSTNGIIVDGQRVAHAVLRAGVVLSIGPMHFRVASPD
jgi:pSer/pThr/pTyr-binding forkhead associated (FHA) protein